MKMSNIKRKTRKNQKGVSLAELIIAVSIIGILASITTLKVTGGFDYAGLQIAADTLITDLRLVRDQARTDQQSFSLMIDPGSCSYQAPGVTSLDGSGDIAVNLQDAPYELSSLSSALTMGNVVMFDADGSSFNVGLITLRRGSKQVKIEIGDEGKIEQIK